MIYTSSNTTWSDSINLTARESLLGGFLGGFLPEACLSRLVMQTRTVEIEGKTAYKEIYDFTTIGASDIVPEFGEPTAEKITSNARTFGYKVFGKNVPYSLEANINTAGAAAVVAGKAAGVAHRKAMEARAWSLQIAPLASGAVESVTNITPSGATTTATMVAPASEQMTLAYISKTLAKMKDAGVPKMPNGHYAIVMSQGAYYDLTGVDSTVFATRKLTGDVVTGGTAVNIYDPLTPVDSILGADIYVTNYAPKITGASNQATKYTASRVLFMGSDSLCKIVSKGNEGVKFIIKQNDFENATSLMAREITDYYVYNPKALYAGYVSDVSLV